MRVGKGLTLFVLNEDMIDIIKTIKSLEDSVILIESRRRKKQESRCFRALLGSLADSLVKPGIFSVVQGISGTGIRRTEDGV